MKKKWLHQHLTHVDKAMIYPDKIQGGYVFVVACAVYGTMMALPASAERLIEIRRMALSSVNSFITTPAWTYLATPNQIEPSFNVEVPRPRTPFHVKSSLSMNAYRCRSLEPYLTARYPVSSQIQAR